MFKVITKDNIELIENSFIDLNKAREELNYNPFGKYLILEENGKIIGYIYYSDIYERAEINQFEIDSIHRNCGKGSRLLEHFIKTVDKDITLEVRIDNAPAIAVYKKFGFENKAIREKYYNGIDGILMERKK